MFGKKPCQSVLIREVGIEPIVKLNVYPFFYLDDTLGADRFCTKCVTQITEFGQKEV